MIEARMVETHLKIILFSLYCKICAVKKNCKHVQWLSTEIWKCYSSSSWKMWKIINMINWNWILLFLIIGNNLVYLWNFLSLNYQLSQIMMLHQYGRNYFAAPLLRITKNLGVNFRNFLHWQETGTYLHSQLKDHYNRTQHKLSQEESNLVRTGLYFSNQLNNLCKSNIFTAFEKIHCLFINNLNSKETKKQVKSDLSLPSYQFVFLQLQTQTLYNLGTLCCTKL